MKRIAIIGAGASGLICAARLAYLLQQGANPDDSKRPAAEIVIFEKNKRIGSPILRSGNGRCNISNASIRITEYHNPVFASQVFDSSKRSCGDELRLFASLIGNAANCLSGCDPEEDPGSIGTPGRNAGTGAVPESLDADIAFFANRGLMFRAESEGRLYPYPNKAAAVLDILQDCISMQASARIDIRTESCVCGIDRKGSGYSIWMEDDCAYQADAVILAVGGKALLDLLDAIPIPRDAVIPPRPMLCPISVEQVVPGRLENIRVKCTATLERNGNSVVFEKGEVLFRKFGLSGISVFNISRHALSGDGIVLDLAPGIGRSELCDILARRSELLQRLYGRIPSNRRCLEGILLPEVAETVLEHAGIRNSASEHDRFVEIAEAVKRFSFTVAAMADTEHAQVYRGGVGIGHVDAQTLEAKDAPGLFVAGEALDVDGPCGGYNLHFAWMSGLLAASAVAERILGGESS